MSLRPLRVLFAFKSFLLTFNYPSQTFCVRRAGDAAVCDDCGDEFCGRHVEGGVLDGDAFGGEALVAYVRDLARVALFNRDLFARGEREVNGRDGRGDVEGDGVLAGEDGDHIGSDLVGRVAVGGDAVGPDDYAVNLALLHHVTGHVVRDDGDGNLVLLKLPGGEARAL